MLNTGHQTVSLRGEKKKKILEDTAKPLSILVGQLPDSITQVLTRGLKIQTGNMGMQKLLSQPGHLWAPLLSSEQASGPSSTWYLRNHQEIGLVECLNGLFSSQNESQ